MKSATKNTPQAAYCYRQARKAIKRLSASQRPEQTVAAICRNLRMAIAADGE
jgi:hypothetical protein